MSELHNAITAAVTDAIATAPAFETPDEEIQRPTKSMAMGPAERMRRYRARRKAQLETSTPESNPAVFARIEFERREACRRMREIRSRSRLSNPVKAVASCVNVSNSNSRPKNVYYPAAGYRDRFPLVSIKGSTYYNPIADLSSTIKLLSGFDIPFNTTIDQIVDFVRMHNKNMEQFRTKVRVPSPELAEHIVSQTYIRTVLNCHRSLTSTGFTQYRRDLGYGEITSKGVTEMVKKFGLSKVCNVVDVGSGMGSVVCDFALQTGADAYGIELLEDRHMLALCFKAELRSAVLKYGVRCGNVEFECGDFTKSESFLEKLSKAS
ncbi:Nucleosomal histone H3-Lys79 methylase, partial [Rhizoclosmatium hyalinum]